MHSLLFWVLDTLSTVVVAAFAGLLTADRTESVLWQNIVPAGVAVAWLLIVVIAFIGWNLFRAPYRQLQEMAQVEDSEDSLAKLVEELQRQQLFEFFKENKTALCSGMAIEGTDRRREALGQLKMLGVVEMQHFAAVPESMFAGVPSGGAAPYDWWKTTAKGDRLARLLNG